MSDDGLRERLIEDVRDSMLATIADEQALGDESYFAESLDGIKDFVRSWFTAAADPAAAALVRWAVSS